MKVRIPTFSNNYDIIEAIMIIWENLFTLLSMFINLSLCQERYVGTINID